MCHSVVRPHPPIGSGLRTIIGTLGLLVLASAPRALAARAPEPAREAIQSSPARIAGVPSDTLERRPPADRGPERDRAVRLAREGRYAEALAILRRLHRESPDDVGLAGDLATVLHWAGEDRAALDLGEELPLGRLDPLVSEAVARSARNVGSAGRAAEIYRRVVERAPERRESQIGLALALTEAGELAEAESRLSVLASGFGDEVEALTARGHVLRAVGRHLEAARVLERALALEPDHAEAHRWRVRSLLALGAHSLALEAMEARPGLHEPAERARILAEAAAQEVRWARIPSPHESFRAGTLDRTIRFAAADRALRRIDAALARVGREDGFTYRQLRFDRLVALRERARMEELWTEARRLEAEGLELPPYAQRMAADAALALRRPEEAERRYRAAIEGWPDDRDARLGLYYALLEQDRHDEARELIEALLASEPTLLPAPGRREPVPNPDRPIIAVADLLGRAFARDLSGAQAGLEALRERAPMNLSVRQELASVYLWRGWPRRALAEFDRILALDPDHLSARIGRATARLDINERGAAGATVDSLLAFAPENEHVRLLARRASAAGAWEIAADAGRATSSGGALGTRDRYLNTRVSGPVGGPIEVFASWRRADASYAETPIDGLHDRLALGSRISGRTGTVTLEVSRNRRGEAKPGGSIAMELTPGDRWTLGVRGASYAFEVPLQATLAGVDGWSLGTELAYRAHEGGRLGAAATLIDMSDGNRRVGVRATLEQDLARGPRSRLAALFDVGAARNSRLDAPYFNPERALAPQASLIWEWIPWRRYEHRFLQRTILTGGGYFQEGHRGEPVIAAGIEHVWELGPRLSFLYGVEWARPLYDGDRERRVGVHAGVTWRVR